MESKKNIVEVEVSVDPDGEHSFEEIESHIVSYLQSSTAMLAVGAEIPTEGLDSTMRASMLATKVASILDGDAKEVSRVPGFQALVQVYPFCLSMDPPSLEEAGGGEEGDGEVVTAAQHWALPHFGFDALWDSLVFDDSDVKGRLLRYAETAILFAEHGVDSAMVTTNRLLLFHGPPGTGKTTICKALAHKLAIRLNKTYPTASLLEINSHSLFSRWFSESGKLVAKLFESIHALADAEDGSTLVCVLIDEVESLTAARQSSMNGNEPSDAVRVVNALLTEVDRLRARPNVLVLATSNLTEAIDPAFLDRADLKQYVGPPVLVARYRILLSSIVELVRKGIVNPSEGMPVAPPAGAATVKTPGSTLHPAASGSSASSGPPPKPSWTLAGGPATAALYRCAQDAEGLSGRSLRKLPFQAHAFHLSASSARSVALALRARAGASGPGAATGGAGAASMDDGQDKAPPSCAIGMKEFLGALLSATRHEQESRTALGTASKPSKLT